MDKQVKIKRLLIIAGIVIAVMVIASTIFFIQSGAAANVFHG